MKRIAFVIVLASLLLATAGVASAQTARIDFSGSEWCPDTFLFGSIRFPGPNLQIRDITQVCYDTASIPQLTGTDYLSDSNLHAVGKGGNFILTGKLRMESVEGGAWVGTWVWATNMDTIQVVAHGEGKYEGMQLHWFLTEEGPFWGYILVTGE